MPDRTLLLIQGDCLGWISLRAIAASLDHTRIVGETDSWQAAMDAAWALTPDAVLSGATIEGRSAIPLLRAVRGLAPGATIIVVAPHFEQRDLDAPAAMRISGYLMWSLHDTRTLTTALSVALTGEVAVTSRPVADAFLTMRLGARVPSVALSERERSVLNGLDAGLSQKQIADTAGIPRRTVENIVKRLQDKLDAPTLFLLGREARERCMI